MNSQIALAVLMAAPSKIRRTMERKPRRRSHRIAGLVLLIALVAILLAVTLSTAHAQAPDSDVHFFYVKSHYQHPSPKAPTNSVTNLSYYGGPVMLTTTTYTIFWAPAGHPISADYQSLINRFFTEVGGSSLYNIMTQYYDNSNHIQNSSTFGGTWVDTTPYPHAGSVVDPLRDTDIRAAVLRAQAANGWLPAPNHLFLVYTASGMAECFDSQDCTPGTLAIVYCAYHSHFVQNTQTILYAFVPYLEAWNDCRSLVNSPNGNLDADATISLMSHELFEAITDPQVGPDHSAWYDHNCNDNTECGEIADKCEYTYGTIAADGSNVTLGSHHYIVQREWSNAAFTGASYSGCVLSYNPPKPPHVLIDQAYTASNQSGTPKKKFVRGARIFYFGAMRNDGSAKCDTSSIWLAKGGARIVMSLVATISVNPGTSRWYVKGRIPANAPLRKYTLTISTICSGQISSASATFKVVAGGAATKNASETVLPEGPFSQ